jgi:hypothetical protein
MQTLERTQELTSSTPPPKRRSRATLFAIAAVVVVLATAALAYAVGSANSSTKTLVKVVPTKAAPVQAAAKPLNCIPGAAPGSCNIDEAKQVGQPDAPLDAATRTLLAQQLVLARAAAARYPTVASARAAGMIQAGQFSPLTGAHFLQYSGIGKFDPSQPGSYIYDGTSPNSKVIGLMYLSLSTYPPEGFAGPNDRWHRHTNTCVMYKGSQIVVPFAADSDVTRAQCDAVGGQFMRETAWMVHAWVVPGWDNPQGGVFAHDNPDVLCADGTAHTDAKGFCKGT